MSQEVINAYLLPGQGSDARIFEGIDLGEEYNLIPVALTTPEEGMTMYEYAVETSKQIDTTSPFILIGVSLGGMLSVELTEFLQPQKTIIISSAKSRAELPFRYRMQSQLGLHPWVPATLIKQSALILQPIVEPDRNNRADVFMAMLQSKDPLYLKRTVAIIVDWERSEVPPGIIHIHGTGDHTLPIKHVDANYVIEGGSHMMTLTRAAEINLMLREILQIGTSL